MMKKGQVVYGVSARRADKLSGLTKKTGHRHGETVGGILRRYFAGGLTTANEFDARALAILKNS